MRHGKSARSVGSHQHFHTASAAWKSKWKPEQRKELRLENYSLLALAKLLVAQKQTRKHDQTQKKLWLTSLYFCLRCKGFRGAIVKKHCHVENKTDNSCTLELQTEWLCKRGQQAVLCLFMLSCFFVDVSVLRSVCSMHHQLPFVFSQQGRLS